MQKVLESEKHPRLLQTNAFVFAILPFTEYRIKIKEDSSITVQIMYCIYTGSPRTAHLPTSLTHFLYVWSVILSRSRTWLDLFKCNHATTDISTTFSNCNCEHHLYKVAVAARLTCVHGMSGSVDVDISLFFCIFGTIEISAVARSLL